MTTPWHQNVLQGSSDAHKSVAYGGGGARSGPAFQIYRIRNQKIFDVIFLAWSGMAALPKGAKAVPYMPEVVPNGVGD